MHCIVVYGDNPVIGFYVIPIKVYCCSVLFCHFFPVLVPGLDSLDQFLVSVSVSVEYWKWTHLLSINYPGGCAQMLLNRARLFF